MNCLAIFTFCFLISVIHVIPTEGQCQGNVAFRSKEHMLTASAVEGLTVKCFDECTSRCIKETYCASGMFYSNTKGSDSNCYLNSASRKTKPSNYVPERNSEYFEPCQKLVPTGGQKRVQTTFAPPPAPPPGSSPGSNSASCSSTASGSGTILDSSSSTASGSGTSQGSDSTAASGSGAGPGSASGPTPGPILGPGHTTARGSSSSTGSSSSFAPAPSPPPVKDELYELVNNNSSGSFENRSLVKEAHERNSNTKRNSDEERNSNAKSDQKGKHQQASKKPKAN